MRTKTVVRLGTVVFVAIAITASVMEARMSPGSVGQDPIVMPNGGGADPLRTALIRCQSLGAAGADDHDCLRAWAENRRRFLSPGSRPEATFPTANAASVNVMIGTDPSTPARHALEATPGQER